MSDSAVLHSYLRPLRQWWWLLVAAGMVSAATAFMYTRAQPDIYQSHATLMVGSAIQDPNPSDTEIQLGLYLARTYAGIAERSSVHDAIKQALGLDVLPEYTVRAVPETQLIELSVVDSDPTRAQAVALELVSQIVQLSPGGQGADDRARFVQSELDGLEHSIAETEAQIVKQQDDLEQATSARQIVTLETQTNALETKLTSLRTNYATLLSTTQTGATNAVHELEQPNLPTAPLNSSGMMLVALAAVAGALLAAAGVYAMDFLDDSLTSVRQVEEQFGLVPLGAVPLTKSGPETGGAPVQRLLMVAHPHSPAAEAYRILRANLNFVTLERPLRVLQISSPTPGDGKSEIAANLAVAMAQTGMQVILVDGDLRHPSQHRTFGLPNNAGLTTALAGGDAELSASLQATGLPNVTLMASGPLPPNPAELIASERMLTILTVLQGLCDVVILDSPPVTVVADTAVLASRVDGVLLVLWVGRTRREQLRHAVSVLRQAHAPLLGVAFNNAHGTDFAPLYDPDNDYSQYFSLQSRALHPAGGAFALADDGASDGMAAGSGLHTSSSTRRPPFLRRSRHDAEGGQMHE